MHLVLTLFHYHALSFCSLLLLKKNKSSAIAVYNEREKRLFNQCGKPHLGEIEGGDQSESMERKG